MKTLRILLFLPLAMFSAAQEVAAPDFSKGMPDVVFESKEDIDDSKVYHLKTKLGSKAFTATLQKVLGADWKSRKLKANEMMISATRGRLSNATVNLSAYVNPKSPGAELIVIHLTPKVGAPESTVEITVFDKALEK